MFTVTFSVTKSLAWPEGQKNKLKTADGLTETVLRQPKIR